MIKFVNNSIHYIIAACLGCGILIQSATLFFAAGQMTEFLHASQVVLEAATNNNKRIDFIVHDLTIDPINKMVIMTRTSTAYPLSITFETKLVDDVSEKTICKGHGFATVEQNDTNSFGPFGIKQWVSQDCPDLSGMEVALIGTWYWTDHDGTPRYTQFRSNPSTFP